MPLAFAIVSPAAFQPSPRLFRTIPLPLRPLSPSPMTTPHRPRRTLPKTPNLTTPPTSKATLEQPSNRPFSSISTLFAGARGALLAVTLHLAAATLFLALFEGWALLDALYFAVVTATTVGYGDITPTNPFSKLFVSLYAILSVALIGGLLQRLVERVADAQQRLATGAARALLKSGGDAEEREGNGLVRKAEMDLEKARMRFHGTVVLVFGAALSVAVLYGLFLKASFVDLLYFVCISMTTVGFGDIHPVAGVGKAYAAIWLVLTSLGFASILSQWADLRLQERQCALAKRFLSQDISDRVFKEIDVDGDESLSEAEFLGYMVCKLGKITPDEVRGVLQRFRELDTDNSGLITKDEVISMKKKAA